MKQNELKEQVKKLEKALTRYPKGEDTALTPIFINASLLTFSKVVPIIEKATKKYMPHQEVLTISKELYDDPADYFEYLTTNKVAILNNLEGIYERASQLSE